jgi:site-specific recombinase XerC
VDGYERWLSARGHAPHFVQVRRWQLAELSAWLEREGLPVSDLSVPAVRERFAGSQRAAGRRTFVSHRSLRVPLRYLREIGAVPPAEPAATGPVEQLLADFRVYLRSERGLGQGTVENYDRAARTFLEDRVAHAGGVGLERLAAADVTGFLARECPRRSVSGARDLAANVRQFLRYLHVVGLIDSPLVWAVPPVADLRGRALPKGVAPEVITAILAACDREVLIGRRDFAVLVLLARLGLRAGEVAAIELDDLDWGAGELLVHGKAHREDRLPLPVDVGEALVEYLRVRPASERRALFLCATAPFAAISSHVVAMVVRRACRRAGIPEIGPHRLRHTAATEMLRARCSLEEVAQVLRHRTLDSTAHYARVDLESLRPLAMPWPEGRS